MKRLTCILIAASLSACSSLPAPAAAQVPGQDPDVRRLQVNATASVQRAPDRAVISLAVETTATEAAAASARNAETMDAVLRAIRGLGIEQSRIQTRRVELQPRYARSRDQDVEPRITGYVARNQVVVTVDDVGLVGRVVDAGVAAGANRVSGISFELRDQESAYHDALREAIGQARREAEVAAAALGESLGPVLNMSTGGFQPMYRAPAPQAEMRMDMAQAAPTPVQPGELDVHATVNITFRIGS